MPVYKDDVRGTWYVTFYFTDWRGRRIRKKKRGIERKKDTQDQEDDFMRSSSRCDTQNVPI